MVMLAASYRRLARHLCSVFALALLSPLCGALTIGAEDDWYPFTAYRDGRVVGMAVDIVRAALETDGTPLELRPYPYARCMELTRRGSLPACFNTSPSPRVSRDYLLPSEPLFLGWIELWSRHDEAAPVEDLKQIAGRKVAVTNGYEYGPVFERFAQLKRVPVRRQINGFRMLQRGRVDFMVAYRGTARALFDDYPELQGQFAVVATLHRPQLFISFSRRHPDAPELLRRFDLGMRAIRANGRYQQILELWQHGKSN